MGQYLTVLAPADRGRSLEPSQGDRRIHVLDNRFVKQFFEIIYRLKTHDSVSSQLQIQNARFSHNFAS